MGLRTERKEILNGTSSESAAFAGDHFREHSVRGAGTATEIIIIGRCEVSERLRRELWKILFSEVLLRDLTAFYEA